MSRAWRRLLPAFVSVAIAVAGLSLAPASPAQAATFTDIAGSPFREDIEWLAARGVTNGCGNGMYCPTAVVTRQEMASFLVRMFGYTAEPSVDPFGDDNGTPHEADINRLFAAGVTTGCAAGWYCPWSPVSRQQMATFLVRALGLYWGGGSDHFDDDDGSLHELDLDRLFFAGITTGCAARWSCNTAGVTREQMAAFLHRTTFAAPIGPPGFAEVVVHPAPIGVQLIGPARFSGVLLSADGATATRAAAFGTIAPAAASADQTALVNGVRYAHLVGGPMSGTWVKVTPALTVAVGRVPAPPSCTYQDILTSRQGYDQYATTLLDTAYMLPSWYAPPDLMDTSAAGLNGGYGVRAVAITDLAAMASDARNAGAPLQVVSAFRSYAQQAATFQYWVSVGGYEQALLTSARAGHSEHQLGTTVDFTSLGGAPPWEYADWGATAAGAWMAANAWRYGFVMSYEPGMTALACYSYEPWHYRYVGRATAAAVQASGMTLRQAIWAAYGP